MVVPLVFLSLTCGAASLGASGSIGRLGGKTISLYLLTAIAVSVALDLLCSLIREKEGNVSVIEPPDYEPKSAPDVKDTLIIFFLIIQLLQWLKVRCYK